ncbi:hypothetical protein M569_16030, partial [Genlisea aurea]
LNGENFLTWRRSILLALSIKNKAGFIDGSIPEPLLTDPTYFAWRRCNDLIVSWLLRSMEPPIAQTVFYISNAKTIYDTIVARFSQPDDNRVCRLYADIGALSQGSKSVSEYFTQLSALWEEL